MISFLDRAPEGNYVDATFYTSDEALEAATAPLYNRAWFDYNQRSIVPIGSGRANDMYSPWNYPQFVTFQVTALDENLSGAMEWILLGSNDGELCNQCGRDADTG